MVIFLLPFQRLLLNDMLLYREFKGCILYVEVMKFLICSCKLLDKLRNYLTMLISHLIYYNSFLSGLLGSAIKPLQLIQKATARVVFDLPKYSHACCPTPRFSALASHSCPDLIQDTGYGLQNHQWICTSGSIRTDCSLCTNQTTTLLHLCLFGDPRRKRSKIKSTKVFGSSSNVVDNHPSHSELLNLFLHSRNVSKLTSFGLASPL
ncbi:hypothetical protein Z043_103405, partial [Scleropages formosus]